MSTEKYKNAIQRKEQEGKQFMYVDGLYDYKTVSPIRTVECPHCGEKQKIDLEDYFWDETLNESRFDDDMRTDIVYSFDTEDSYGFIKCGDSFQVIGWIREYPMGTYDSENIDVKTL